MPPAQIPAPGFCLDITRLISRAGRGAWTGVDRVELAYLRALVAEPSPLHLLVRTWLGYLLLDQSGAEAVLKRFDGAQVWGAVDLAGRFQRKAHPEKRRWEADLRRLSIARCRHRRLGAMLARCLPSGCRYLNVGHSHLSDFALSQWNRVENAHVSVLVHDMIPLDFPQFQRPGTVTRFEQKMRAVAARADRVICISAATEARVRHWFTAWGHDVATLVAPIGVTPLPAPEPAPAPPKRPYFVALGTLEPRKNHALLLDVWEDLGPSAPGLVLAGARGWANEALFQRLDRLKSAGAPIQEVAGLSDGQVAGLLAGAAGLVFPSLAEGFGLPPAEAILLGRPVICSDLPVFREILGDCPIYAGTSDMYLWKQSILRLAEQNMLEQGERGQKTVNACVPTWEAHFKTVLRET